ncbi:hypothetical protein OBV_33510 [Oscillibacter valericigenes Sjm18-20]|nr:hypothetical protein OBV_33510 [Oscillibacter valericigenes Sjm18-20]
MRKGKNLTEYPWRLKMSDRRYKFEEEQWKRVKELILHSWRRRMIGLFRDVDGTAGQGGKACRNDWTMETI